MDAWWDQEVKKVPGTLKNEEKKRKEEKKEKRMNEMRAEEEMKKEQKSDEMKKEEEKRNKMPKREMRAWAHTVSKVIYIDNRERVFAWRWVRKVFRVIEVDDMINKSLII